MEREISAGGVVLRPVAGEWRVSVIEPQREASNPVAKGKKKSQKVLLALPKGLVDAGEKPEQTAVREVQEETGIMAVPITKLPDIKYVYVRNWSDGQRVFKIVSFYLLRYRSGRIDDIAPEMRIEVKRAQWLALEDAARRLTYSNERTVVRQAIGYLQAHPQP